MSDGQEPHRKHAAQSSARSGHEVHGSQVDSHAAAAAHKIGFELRHNQFEQARAALQNEAHLHPQEFSNLLKQIDSDLKLNHLSSLSVERDKDGQVTHINFGNHDIYNGSADQSPSPDSPKSPNSKDKAPSKHHEPAERLPAPVQHDVDAAYRSRNHHGKHHAHSGGHHRGAHRSGRQNDDASRFVEPSESKGDPSDGHNQSQNGGSDRPLNPSAASPSKSGFGQKLLEKLGLPVTQKNLHFLDAWQKAEGGSSDNPFNTTQNAPGARNFNRVGVKRYPSMEVGLDATVKTLNNGHYKGILNALAHEDIHGAAAALRVSAWGTKHIYV